MLELIDASDGAAWLAHGAVEREELAKVQYSARYALTLFFPPSMGAIFAEHADWVAKYVAKVSPPITI